MEEGARRILDVSPSLSLEVAAKRGKAILGYIGDTHVSTVLFKSLQVNSNTRVCLAVSSLLFIQSNQKSDHQDLEIFISRDPLSFSIVWI